jgi:ATP synthase protein I
LVVGLAVGCLNAWYWVAKEAKAMQDETEDDDE